MHGWMDGSSKQATREGKDDLSTTHNPPPPSVGRSMHRACAFIEVEELWIGVTSFRLGLVRLYR